MRKRRKYKSKSKLNKIIIILFIIISFFFLKYCIQAFNNNKNEENKKINLEKERADKVKKIDTKLENIYLKLAKTKTKIEQKYIYKKLTDILSIKFSKIHFVKNGEKKENNDNNDNKNFIIKYIITKIKEKNNSIKIEKKVFEKHKTKILRFARKGNHKIILDKFFKENDKKIINSVFIFKQKLDLSRDDINFITKELKKYNKNILIFIDQEGGVINRYVDFEKASEIEDFFGDINKESKYDFLKTRFKLFNKKELQIIKNIFPKQYGYFPSLGTIGKKYDLFDTKDKKRTFLEIIAFIRLQSLKNNGINTYSLVVDLNRGNPVISNNSRSFSRHLWKYKQLANAFLKTSRKTGILLYLKHFPGHGAGKIDSHKGVLNLVKNKKYLKENLELFDYFFKNREFIQIGLMVGHMYISEKLKKEFQKIIKKSDFLLTDDLGMIGYKKAKGKIKKGLFFTTDEIINENNLIIVDTIDIVKIK